jgi:hypothetical protein
MRIYRASPAGLQRDASWPWGRTSELIMNSKCKSRPKASERRRTREEANQRSRTAVARALARNSGSVKLDMSAPRFAIDSKY